MQGRLLPMAALLVMSGSAALADTPAQARKAIEAIFAKEAAALSRKDLNSALAYQAPDYVGITKDGKRYNREQTRQLTQPLRKSKSISETDHITHFTFKGDTVLARVKSHMIVIVLNSQTNKSVAVTIDSLTDETWVKRSGKWLCKHERQIESSQKFSDVK